MENFDQVRADALFLKGEYLSAFEMYLNEARESRDPRAAFDVAYMCHRGIGVPQNFGLAREFYMAASMLEGGAALYNLALLNIRGQGGEADFKAAIRYMHQAAEMDCADARLYLGVAYTTGCAFDPLDIECISMIPFYRVIKRSADTIQLGGVSTDPEIEAKRFEAVQQDEYTAVDMFEAVDKIKDKTYIEEQVGTAKLMVGQALIEGVGKDYNPQQGYRLIASAALGGSTEAAQYLLQNAEKAASYGVSKEMLLLLAGSIDT